jgi:hypothetical protein
MGNGGHMGGGGRRPQRYGGGGHNHGGFQKPRKNFPALREKYLNMAKDALSSGDRVLAEYYLQHADHYFRMQAEFQAERAASRPQEQGQQEAQEQEQPEDAEAEGAAGSDEPDIDIPNNSNVLPAFLTRQVPPPAQPPQQASEGKVAATGWEDE